MSDFFLNLMLIPIVFLPVMCLYRVIGIKDMLLLCSYFFLSSLLYIAIGNSLIVFPLLLLYCIFKVYGGKLKLFFCRFCTKTAIVVSVDCHNSEVIISDGSRRYSVFVLEPRAFSIGSIVRLF